MKTADMWNCWDQKQDFKEWGLSMQLVFTGSDMLFMSSADRDAGAEGGEEGSMRLHAHQLTALSSARVHLRTLPPAVTTRHTENNPDLKTSTHAQRFFILSYLRVRHFILFPVTSTLSEAFV